MLQRGNEHLLFRLTRLASLLVSISALGGGPVRAEGEGPAIDVWYGSEQTFGHPGVPQRWVNILGNVSDSDGVASLSYRLNGGELKPLSIGPDTRRLLMPGDFNIDIDYADLQPGLNEVAISATDANSNGSTTTVTVNYAAGNAWPLPYTIDWSTVDTLSDAVQVVDGKWDFTSNGVRPIELGYDRLLAIGERFGWTDYEVTLPITIHGIDPAGYQWPSVAPGLAIMLRWQGHTKWGDWQPWIFWRPNGASAWYYYGGGPHFELQGDARVIVADTSGRTLDNDVPYYWKVRVETIPGTGSFYSMRVWEVGTPEPIPWDLTGWQGTDDLPSGSFLLIAHHVDATFGNITVSPVLGTDPPLIFDEQVSPEANWAMVQWTTDVPADSRVEYGLTDAYELGTVSDAAKTLEHAIVLAGLEAETTYHFRITSERPSGVSASTEDQIFTTSAPDTTPPVISLVQASPDRFSAVITWSTDEPTTGGVAYGLTESYEIGSEEDETLSLSHSVTFLGLTPETLYHFQVTAEDWAGNVAWSESLTFTTAPLPPPIVVSDDFCCAVLDTGVWTFIDPKGDGSYAMTGGQITLSVPHGVSHDVWTGGNFAPRIMQPITNADMEIEIKFDSPLSVRYQMQGLVVEQDANNYVRFDFHYESGTTRAFGATVTNGSPVARFNVVVPDGAPMYMRVQRAGSTWTCRHSHDGETWAVAGSFSSALVVSSAGVFVGNEGFGSSPPPAFTAVVDYFYSTSDILGGATPGDCAALTDCNSNGNPDICDILEGASPDVNTNGVPDECEDLCMVDGEPVDCSHLDSDCTLGVCDPQTGQCLVQPFNEDGPCDDGDPCTTDDHCEAGVCSGTFADADNDGICDALDNCPTVWNPDQTDTSTNGYGDVCDGLFDADHDGDVDHDDYVSFEGCLGGPGTLASLPCRDVHDTDADDDVDLLDWAEFQVLFGSYQPPVGPRG